MRTRGAEPHVLHQPALHGAAHGGGALRHVSPEWTDEADEIGFEDATIRGLAIVEWPERIAPLLAAERFDVTLTETTDAAKRQVMITATGACGERLARLHQVMDFLEAQPAWRTCRIAYLQGDASTRAYARLHGTTGTAILMDAPRQPDGPPVRDGKPYSQIAHLAEDMRPFSAIADALRAAGLSAPQILAQDLGAGLLLIEDLGDRVYGAELQRGGSQEELWRAAVDVLLKLRSSLCGTSALA